MCLSDTQITFGNLRHFQTFPLSERSFLAWTDWSFTYFVCNNSRAALIKRDLRVVLSLICFRTPPGSIRGSFSRVNQCACTAGPLPWPDNSAQVPHLSRFDLDTSESIPPRKVTESLSLCNLEWLFAALKAYSTFDWLQGVGLLLHCHSTVLRRPF